MSTNLKNPLGVALFSALVVSIEMAKREGRITAETQEFITDQSFEVFNALLNGELVAENNAAPIRLSATNAYAAMVDAMLNTQIEGSVLEAEMAGQEMQA